MTYKDPFTIHPSYVGFDRVARLFADSIEKKTTNYPPYNIVKTGDNSYSIEIAVAGFDREDLDIQVAERIVSVAGQTSNTESTEFLYKGVAQRNFLHKFTLADTVEVSSADLKNGMLTINLENIIPQEKMPRKISIGNVSEKELLTE